MNQRLARMQSASIRDVGIPYTVPDVIMLLKTGIGGVHHCVLGGSMRVTPRPPVRSWVRAELCVEATRLGPFVGRTGARARGRRRSAGVDAADRRSSRDARRRTGNPDLARGPRSQFVARRADRGGRRARAALARARPDELRSASGDRGFCTREAPTSAATDWPQIVGLYDRLALLQKGPIVSLNRAAAVTMADGPEAALRLLDALEQQGALSEYHLFHAARADVLRRLGRHDAALRAYRRALELVSERAGAPIS